MRHTAKMMTEAVAAAMAHRDTALLVGRRVGKNAALAHADRAVTLMASAGLTAEEAVYHTSDEHQLSARTCPVCTGSYVGVAL